MGVRHRARIVAIIDMTLTVISALLLTGLLFLMIFKEEVIYNYFSTAVQENGQTLDEATFNSVLKFMKWVTGIGCAFAVIQLIAAGCLIKGTKKEITKNQALTYCKSWRGVTIFILVLNYLSIIRLFSDFSIVTVIMTFLPIMYRHYTIKVVNDYNKELSLEVKSADQRVVRL